MSEVFADPELTRLAVVVVYLGASRFLDLEALLLRFGTARTPRLSRRHVVNWARRSRFMHFAKTASHWVRVGVNIIRAMPTMLCTIADIKQYKKHTFGRGTTALELVHWRPQYTDVPSTR
jgi:hypothetical protein